MVRESARALHGTRLRRRWFFGSDGNVRMASRTQWLAMVRTLTSFARRNSVRTTFTCPSWKCFEDTFQGGSASICGHAAFGQRCQHFLALESILQNSLSCYILRVLRCKVNQGHHGKKCRVHNEPVRAIQQSFLLHLYAQMDMVSRKVDVGSRAGICTLVNVTGSLVGRDKMQEWPVEQCLSMSVCDA